MKYTRDTHDRRKPPSKGFGREKWGPRPWAARLLLTGYILILLSLCDFAARLYAGTSWEALLYIETYMGSVSAATVILWAAALGLDWLERTQDGHTK